jgi:hypothetical protein
MVPRGALAGGTVCTGATGEDAVTVVFVTTGFATALAATGVMTVLMGNDITDSL